MIRYDSKNEYCKKPFGAVLKGEQLCFTISMDGDREIHSVTMRITREGSAEECVDGVFREIKGQEKAFSFFWRSHEAGLYFYNFEAVSDDIKETTHSFQLTVYEKDDYASPTWLQKGIMYQIFPDRFAKKGNLAASLHRREYILHENWGEEPFAADPKTGMILNNDFFGGNIEGIILELDYLLELGVTVIYLNPIFEAFSNHRYDTGNYKKIDSLLGTEDDFKRLCDECHSRGMRVILDGVFNHTGSDSLYFNKYGNYGEDGAFQSPKSTYFSWYNFQEYPHKYSSWWGIDTLPAVDESNKEYMDYILTSEDSVIKQWLRAGADGVRLDVADELPDCFLDKLREVVKAENSRAAIIGEVWEDASNKVAYGQRRRYLQGKQLDSVMNYPLKEAIISFINCNIDGAEFARRINELWENYPEHIFNSLMNILGTHDTERILTVFESACTGYGEARQKLFAALLIWGTMPGIPCIYYGDEIGMTGGQDPFNRRCFQKEKANEEILIFFKKLLKFRQSIDDIEDMRFCGCTAEGGYIVLERKHEKRRLITAVNTDCEERVLFIGDNSILKNFAVSGEVFFAGMGNIIIKGKSGICVYVAETFEIDGSEKDT